MAAGIFSECTGQYVAVLDKCAAGRHKMVSLLLKLALTIVHGVHSATLQPRQQSLQVALAISLAVMSNDDNIQS